MIPAPVMAKLAKDAYRSPATYENADVHATLAMVDGVTIITFRGSNDIVAWWRDFLVFGADTFSHHELGPVHAGIYGDVMQIFDMIERDVGDAPVSACGHSKGAGEAQIYVAERLIRKRPVTQLTTFGAPRIGALNGLLVPVVGDDFADWRDPVPEVPIWLAHPRPRTYVGERGIDEISAHLMTNYALRVEHA